MGEINKIVIDHGYQINDGVIDLGWENEWSQQTIDIFTELIKFVKKGTYSKGTYSRKGDADYQIKTFIIEKDDEQYSVVYKLDSGD